MKKNVVLIEAYGSTGEIHINRDGLIANVPNYFSHEQMSIKPAVLMEHLKNGKNGTFLWGTTEFYNSDGAKVKIWLLPSQIGLQVERDEFLSAAKAVVDEIKEWRVFWSVLGLAIASSAEGYLLSFEPKPVLWLSVGLIVMIGLFISYYRNSK